MKKILIALAAFAGLSLAVSAQTFTVTNSGFTDQALFTTAAGFNISAIGTDGSGNLYYLETGAFDGTNTTTELFSRTAASNYSSSSETLLYNYGSPQSTSFVKVNGSTVYFGENGIGTINSISTSGAPNTFQNITTLVNNYDLAFNGTSAFVDAADAGFSNNLISALNTSTGQLTPVLQTAGSSGPIAFTSNGSLLYGTTIGEDKVTAGIYSFSAAQVSAAIANKTPLTLSQGTLVFANGWNQYLAYLNDNALYQEVSPFSGAPSPTPAIPTLSLLNPTTFDSETVGEITDGESFFDGVGAIGNGVAIAVTENFVDGPTTIYMVTQVPEPGSLMFLIFGSAPFILGRTFRKKWVA